MDEYVRYNGIHTAIIKNYNYTPSKWTHNAEPKTDMKEYTDSITL